MDLTPGSRNLAEDSTPVGSTPGLGTDPPAEARPISRRWFQQVELWVIVLLVVGIHFTRLDVVMLHGEETRRATVAMEMLRSSDWIVPDLQGEIYFVSNRPPLHQWLIAAVGAWRGDVDAVAVRLPSVLAVLMTTLVIFAYGQVFLSRAGAFAAAAAFPTMAEVLEMGSLGETDPLFTLFVSSSLLLWHIGFERRWAPVLTWGIAYFCVALATLIKGPQGPIYFAFSVGLYLLVTRQWRYGFSWGHAFGIGVFCLVWGGWLVPFLLKTDFEAVRYVYFGDVVRYGTADGLGPIARHVVEYPIRLFACLLPWSIVLLGYLRRDMRHAIGDARTPLVLLPLRNPDHRSERVVDRSRGITVLHAAVSVLCHPVWHCLSTLGGPSRVVEPEDHLESVCGRPEHRDATDRHRHRRGVVR